MRRARTCVMQQFICTFIPFLQKIIKFYLSFKYSSYMTDTDHVSSRESFLCTPTIRNLFVIRFGAEHKPAGRCTDTTSHLRTYFL
jgi:hypothetical protein